MSYDVDIVMLSDSKNDRIIDMTQGAINSLHQSEDKVNFKVYLVESNDIIYYSGVKQIIHKNEEKFNFNKFMNIGRKKGESPYVCLSNNDVVFHEGWASTIIDFMEEHSEVLSASPRCQFTNGNPVEPVQYGYTISDRIAGWCIFQQRKIYDIIGDLDERFNFWCADDDYGETLKKNDLKHARINNAVVNHLESVTLDSLDRNTKNKYTIQQRRIFRRKWTKNWRIWLRSWWKY